MEHNNFALTNGNMKWLRDYLQIINKDAKILQRGGKTEKITFEELATQIHRELEIFLFKGKINERF